MTAIVIPRGLARAFRAVARKCSVGRPRGPAPPVVVTAAAGRLTLTTFGPSAVLVCDVVAPGVSDGTVIVPAEVLDAVATGGPVELSATGTRGAARWADGSGPREREFDVEHPPQPARSPDRPERWGRVPLGFLCALHECGRAAAREPSPRFATTRIQVRGTAGQVIGTDGHQALVWAGFPLPFAGDLLVPALPVFGAKDLAAAGDARVGVTATHLVVAAGPWTVFLPVDATARFPDVAGVVPRAARATVVDLDGADARRLLDRVTQRPPQPVDDPAVTLAVGQAVAFRVAVGGGVALVPAPASASAGPPVTVTLRASHAARALALGLRQVRVAGPDKPVVFRDQDRTYLAMPLAADVGGPSPPAAGANTDAAPAASFPISQPESEVTPMTDREPSRRHDPPDPLAEALKAALAEAHARAGRLAAALKHERKKSKVLSTAWTALKALDLGSGGGS